MAEHVDHVELIFGIDGELNSDSNGEDLQKIAAGLGVLWFINLFIPGAFTKDSSCQGIQNPEVMVTQSFTPSNDWTL